jgi:hypothetical protein
VHALATAILTEARRVPGLSGSSTVAELLVQRENVLLPQLRAAGSMLVSLVADQSLTLDATSLWRIAVDGCRLLSTAGLADEAHGLGRAVLSVLECDRDEWIGFHVRRERVRPTNSPIADWTSADIAEQLTLVSHALFRAIDTREILKTAWTSKTAQVRSPHVRRMIAFFNATSRWVSIEIVEGTTIRARRNAIAKFVRVASQLRALRNADSLFAVLAGVSSVSVHRLKKTWETVPSRVTERHQELRTIMNSAGNFAELRSLVESSIGSGEPCIPYLGYYLTSLTFIEDGNQSRTESGKINFVKQRHIGRVVRMLQTLQQRRYSINPDHTMVNFLRTAGDRMSDDMVHKLSLLREPREQR